MEKRPLLISTIFFIAGILLKIFDADIAAIFIGVIALCTVAYALNKKTSLILLCVIFFFTGYFRQAVTNNYRDKVTMEFEKTTELRTMTVTDFSQGENTVVRFSDNGRNIKVYLKIPGETELKPGDKIRAEVTLSPAYSEEDATGFGAYLSGRGIYLLAEADSVEICGMDNNIIYRIRRYMDSVGEKRFSGDTRALFNAMVFGDKHLMSDNLKNDMQKAGLNHIAAVSGMHLSVVVAAVMLIIGKIFGKRRRGNIVCIAVVLVITFLTGAGASVVRAFIMSSAYSLARFARREPDSLSALSLAVLLMGLFNPWVVMNVGFILSVCAVTGILLFYNKIYGGLKKLMPDGVAGTIALSVSAQIMVTIPVAYYFGVFTPYSVISNLLAAPFAGLSVVLGMLTIVVDNIPVLGDVCAFLEKGCMWILIRICDVVSGFPYAAIPVAKQ